MKDGIIIQARTGSTRLPGKILLPFYNGACIIDLLTARVKRSCPGKTVVLATTVRQQDDVLEEAARKAGVACFRGDEENVLGRFIGAAEAFGLERFIRVCSDNPFLQTDSFEALFKAHDASGADYVSFAFADGLPVIKSHLGLFAELATTEALRRVAAATSERPCLEHVTIYLYTHPEAFKLHLLPLPAGLEGRKDLRFTLDTPDDFTLLQTLYAAYREGGEHTLPALLRLVESCPEYRAVMWRNITHNSK